MPEKDILTAIWAAFTGLSAATKGAMMAVIISFLRVAYDGKESSRVRMTLEALLCGALSLCATSLIAWVNLPEDMAIAVGGAVGFMGVTALRERILRIIDKHS